MRKGWDMTQETPDNVTPIGDAMGAAKAMPQEQIGLEDKFIEDPDVVQVLEEREELKAAKKKATKEYNDKHAAAKDRIEKLAIPIGGAVRVGRFRLERTPVAGRSVSFEIAETTRVAIAVIED